jgi:lipopolysaccharide/colanic/teichoic acid biosynthesis glycosyltransferase
VQTKRLFDITFAALGLLVLSPLLPLLAIAVKLSSRGPVLFRQQRIGQGGRPFYIVKFRSMVENAEDLGLGLTRDGDPRITAMGRFLRRTKLDELPQLWNVLRGEMSFVGPRPEVPAYVAKYTAVQREILKCRPGITDMATMHFRDEEILLRGAKDVEEFYLQYCLPKKIDLNRHYAQQAGLLQDVWIILQTLCPYWLGVLATYCIMLVASLWLSYQLRFDFQVKSSDYAEFARCLPWIVSLQLIPMVWRKQFFGMLSYFSLAELRRLVAALAVALLLQLGLWYASNGRLAPARSILAIHFLLSLVGLGCLRMALRLLREGAYSNTTKNHALVQRIAIVGTGDEATRLALDLTTRPGNSIHVLAFFDDDPRSWQKRPYGIPVMGMPECLLNAHWLEQLDEVIIALPSERAERAEELRRVLAESPLRVTIAGVHFARGNREP